MPTYKVLVTRFYAQTAMAEVDAEDEAEATSITAESPPDDCEFEPDDAGLPDEYYVLED